MTWIQEEEIDWNILFNALELEIPIKAEDYPIVIQIHDTSNVMVLEATFKQAPVTFKSVLPPGRYRYTAMKNGKRIYATSYITNYHS